MVLKAQGDYEGALENFNKALEISKAAFGKNHPNIATGYNNIAKLYFDKGEPEKGLPYVANAYKIRYKFLGPEHPDSKNSRLGVKLHGGDPEAVEREARAEMEKEKEGK